MSWRILWAKIALVHRPALDWESTLAFRHHLWSLGLGVAEAMDTAQRGMGLDWTTTQELIRRSAADAKLGLKSDRLRSAGRTSFRMGAVTRFMRL